MPIKLLISSQSEPGLQSSFTCFPNPFIHQITLENIPEGAHHIVAFDQLGTAILKRKIASSSEEISLPPGPGGMYAIVAFNLQGQIMGSYRLIRVAE
ncbi:MAG: hypothetical protein K9I85_09110 [Saprospiraceae bacterium]|nr:hypothetical protein [Saprospiraceae bacterium]